MSTDPPNTPRTNTSRRTGIDRRWIASSNHQPERRCGGDRRKPRKRSVVDPSATNEPEGSRAVFPEMDSGPEAPGVNSTGAQVTEKWTPVDPQATLNQDASDDT